MAQNGFSGDVRQEASKRLPSRKAEKSPLCPVQLLAATIGAVLLVTAYSLGESLKCSYCGEIIKTGAYFQVDRNFYHQGHFLCAACDKPIGTSRFVRADNRYFHADCYADRVAPRCEHCSRPIKGPYTVYGGRNYHDTCYNNHVALRCDFCGEIIVGNHLVSYWGDRYHEHHQGVIPECRYCGRFLGDRATGGGFRYSDGRTFCNLCWKTAVNDLSEAKQLFQDTRRALQQQGIVIDYDELNLSLVPEKHLSRLTKDGRGEHSGLTKHEFTTRNGTVTDRSFKIYILEGMPRMHFISTAAHELMHVWLYLNAPLELNPPLREGSCNYASLLALRAFPGPEADYLAANLQQGQSEVYGEGFRRVKRLASDVGMTSWLDHLTANTDFPTGY